MVLWGQVMKCKGGWVGKVNPSYGSIMNLDSSLKWGEGSVCTEAVGFYQFLDLCWICFDIAVIADNS